MAEITWLQIIATAFGSGLTVKALDIGYQELMRRRSQSITAAQFVDQHLDPLLKAADELVGKLRALAEADFKSISAIKLGGHDLDNHEFAGLVFLFGRFWGQIEIIRPGGMSVAMAKDRRGKKLQLFFDCLESRRVRIIDRTLQRAVGEAFVQNHQAISFVEFVERYGNNRSTRRWVGPLVKFLSRTRHTSERQQLLQYGAVLHALIDTLDPEHLVTRDRPSWPNKLSERSWADLNYRVFGVYLKFVAGRHKYLGPPKKAARKQSRKGGSAIGLWSLQKIFGLGTSVGLPLARRHRKGATHRIK